MCAATATSTESASRVGSSPWLKSLGIGTDHWTTAAGSADHCIRGHKRHRGFAACRIVAGCALPLPGRAQVSGIRHPCHECRRQCRSISCCFKQYSEAEADSDVNANGFGSGQGSRILKT